MPVQDRPFGLWPSPLSPSQMAAQRRLSDVAWDDTTGSLVWLEARSGYGMLLADQGQGDAPRELNVERSARAQVGYGGGDMTASQGQVYYVSEGRLFRQPLAQGVEAPTTPSFGDVAAPAVSPDGRWVAVVHAYEGEDRLAIVDAEGLRWPVKLTEGHDFYMQPTWHPVGSKIAWIAWDHPQMPWDGTLLYLADLDIVNGGTPRVANPAVIAGDADASVFQPAFAPRGRSLAYVSDAGGWYGLYLYALDTGMHRPLVEVEAELGRSAWAQGMRTYAWAPDGESIYYVQSSLGYDELWQVDVASGETRQVPGLEEYTHLSQPTISRAGVLACIAASPQTPARVITLDPANGTVRVVARSSSEAIPTERLVVPESVTWQTDTGELVHGLFYEPQAPAREERPPLVVLVHGGPTGQATASYSPQVQFLATRGYAVLEVNYRGSSGYGRAYRNALRESWGILDVEDAIGGASYLVEAGRADRNRLVIMGGSAGGYTVLQALVHHPGFFRAGVCLYGVTNLFTLAADTHKFEARYLDSIIGPLPQQAARYRERSPLFYADRIDDPIIVFQGEDDRVVPKAQADEIVQALRHKGVPHEYHLYPGEGHGWRKAETIEQFYAALDAFLKQYVIFG